jgi:hypothetical protein
MRRALELLSVCAALSTGCRAILGIQDLPAGDAGGDGGSMVNDGGTDGPAPQDGGLDVVALCPRPDGGTVTSAELEWALWPMPNSPVDHLGGAPNLETYETDTDAGTVTDKVTGLMWQEFATDTGVQSGAIAYCDKLELAGYQDWRLPTYLQLASIVDLGQQNPSIDPGSFPNTAADVFWSSTVSAGTMSSDGWTVSFVDGRTSRDSAIGIHHARCVRWPGVTVVNPDAGPACTRYVVVSVANGVVVTDQMTGLTWPAAPTRGTDNASGAADYCKTLSYAGMSGWRLPTASELLTLVDVTQISPALDPSAFSTTEDESFWSISSVVGSPADTWLLNLGPGIRGSAPMTMSQAVRCVHGSP